MANEPNQCGNCFFSKDTKMTRFDVKIVACRHTSPKQSDRQDSPGPYPFPMIKETEWRGEYKERETDVEEKE